MNDAADPEILREALRRMVVYLEGDDLRGAPYEDYLASRALTGLGNHVDEDSANRGLASIRAAVAARRTLGEQHRDPHAPPAPVEPLDLIRRMVALDDSRCIEEGSCREFYFLLDEMRELLGKGPMGPAGEERRSKEKG